MHWPCRVHANVVAPCSSLRNVMEAVCTHKAQTHCCVVLLFTQNLWALYHYLIVQTLFASDLAVESLGMLPKGPEVAARSAIVP